jgi:hypothetical protein
VLLNIVPRSEIYPILTTRLGKKWRIRLITFRSNYRNYPLLSNNVGIDFCGLGPPPGSKPSQAGPKRQGLEKQDDLITIGFRVKPKEKAIIQDYVNKMYNQFIVIRAEYQAAKTDARKSVERPYDQACILFVYDVIYFVPTSRNLSEIII